jgi:AbrB family looped-hinge helix DNA binding protein
MSANSKPVPAPSFLAKVTSKGQVTVPVEIRRFLGVKPGEHLRFEPQADGIRLLRDTAAENPFEKWRGIGTGFPIKGEGPKAVVAFFREMRGHDDID